MYNYSPMSVRAFIFSAPICNRSLQSHKRGSSGRYPLLSRCWSNGMTASKIDLGHLSVSSTKSSLSLSAIGSVDVHTLTNSFVLHNPAELLELLSSRRIWASRGTGFHLSFYVRFSPWTAPNDSWLIEPRVQELGKALRDAEVVVSTLR